MFEGGPEFGKNPEIASFSEMSVNQKWAPVYGERSEITDNYNQAAIRLKEKNAPGREFEITFRAYNEGVAFNYTFLSKTENRSLRILKEQTEFKLSHNFFCWASERAQSDISKIPVNPVSKPVERPLVIEAGNNTLALGEAMLVDFARMKFIKGEREISLVSSTVILHPGLQKKWGAMFRNWQKRIDLQSMAVFVLVRLPARFSGEKRWRREFRRVHPKQP